MAAETASQSVPPEAPKLKPEERVGQIIDKLDALSAQVASSDADKTSKIDASISSLKDLLANEEDRKAIQTVSAEKLQTLRSKIDLLKTTEVKDKLNAIPGINDIVNDTRTKVSAVMSLEDQKIADQTADDVEKNPVGFFGKITAGFKNILSTAKESPVEAIMAMVTMVAEQWNTVQDFLAAKLGPVLKPLSKVTGLLGIGMIGLDPLREKIVDKLAAKNKKEVNTKNVGRIRRAYEALQSQGIPEDKLIDELVATAPNIPKSEAELTAFAAKHKPAPAPATPPAAAPAAAPGAAPGAAPVAPEAQNTVPVISAAVSGIDVQYKGRKMEVRVLSDGKLKVGDKVWGLKLAKSDGGVESSYVNTFLTLRSIGTYQESVFITLGETSGQFTLPKESVPDLLNSIIENKPYTFTQQSPGKFYGTTTRELRFETV